MGAAQERWNQSLAGRAAQRRYRQSAKGRATARIHAFAARYGFTAALAREILAAKPEACEICGATDTRLNFDHDHATGAHRGWLCTNCNRGLFYLERPGWVVAAQAYLEQHV